MNKPISVLLAAFVLSTAVASGALAAPVNSVAFTRGKVWLDGQSTLHPYSSSSKKIDVSVKFASNSAADGLPGLLKAGALSDAVVSVPVKSLKSGEGMLDSNLYQALKADKDPDIRFNLTHYQVTKADSDRFSLLAQGVLSIAGRDRPIELPMDGTIAAGTLHLAGHKALKMSDFGVEPPTMMFGALRVKDKVVVHFELTGQVH